MVCPFEQLIPSAWEQKGCHNLAFENSKGSSAVIYGERMEKQT